MEMSDWSSDVCSSDLQHYQADFRAQFCRHYREEAEEYDKEFMKKHDGDLNTTLIPVRHGRCLGTHVLSRVAGWSLLRRNLRVHPGPSPAPTRPERRDSCSPSSPYLRDEQFRSLWQRSYGPTVGSSSALSRPGPKPSVRVSSPPSPPLSSQCSTSSG